MRLTRRGLIVATATTGLLAGCGEQSPTRTSGRSRRFTYGEDRSTQYADLRLPTDTHPLATVVLLHGGYWLPQYAADLMEPMAERLTGLGLATWNVEYRRTGAGGGYPDTLLDVASAIDRLSEDDLPASITENVVLLGHSAGGHLAVWAASRTTRTPGGAPRVVPRSAISLSGILDLTVAAGDPRSTELVSAFIGGLPADRPEQYALADPALLLPAACRVWAAHADNDGVVPLEQSTGYVAKATAAGGNAVHVPLSGDHSSIIDPRSAAFPRIRELIAAR